VEGLVDATDEQIEAYVNEKFKDAPNKAYGLSTDGMMLFIGKAGMIRYEIIFLKEIRDNLRKCKDE
jgi:hypothetical protein